MQPILADEVQTFKALITVHKVLQEGHPVVSLAKHIILQFSNLYMYRLLKRLMVKLHGSKLVPELLAQTVNEVGLLSFSSNGLDRSRSLSSTRLRSSHQDLCPVYLGQAKVPSSSARIQWFVRIRRICDLERNR